MGFEINSEGPFINRVLSVRPFVWIGLISYSLYLWHWPLFAFTKYFSMTPPSTLVNCVLLATSVLLAWLSYRIVERPFRSRETMRSRGQVFWLSGAAASVLLLAALGLWAGKGYPQRLPADTVKFAEGKNDWSTEFGGDTRLEDIPDHLTKLGAKEAPVAVFVWGDSHAAAILSAVDAACRKLNIGALAAKSSSVAPVAGWVSPNLGQGPETERYNQALLEAIQNLAIKGTLHTVILAARWSGYSDGQNPEFNLAVRKTVDQITQSGCTVVILHEVPNFPFEAPKALALAKMQGKNLHELVISLEDYEEKFAPHLESWRKIGEENAKVRILNPGALFADTYGIISPFDSGGVLYRDSHHLTIHGSMRLKEELCKFFSK